MGMAAAASPHNFVLESEFGKVPILIEFAETPVASEFKL